MACLGHQVDLFSRSLQPSELDVVKKLRWHAREVFRGVERCEITGGLFSIKTPTFHLFFGKGKWVARRVEKVSAFFLEREKYDGILTEAYGGFWMPKKRGVPQVYDLVDDHAAGFRHGGEPRTAEEVDRYLRHAVRVCDQLTVSSRVLADFSLKKFGRQAQVIPNGADVKRIRSVANQERRPGPIRIGYVGGLDSFVRIEFLIEVVSAVRARGADVEVVIVGHGPAIQNIKLPTWVKYLGFRKPDEIPLILADFDIGVVPFEISPYTDAALPLKVIEYGAARKPTLSSPLEELKRHQLPWVRLEPLRLDRWKNALEEMIQTFHSVGKTSNSAWDGAWDAVVDRYDWLEAAAEMLRVIKK